MPPLATARSVPLQLPLLIVDAVASDPRPRLVRAVPASDAPVPPLATARSAPLQLPLLIVDAVAKDPRPNDVLTVAPDSATQLVPSPTMKFPSVTDNPAISARPAS